MIAAAGYGVVDRGRPVQVINLLVEVDNLLVEVDTVHVEMDNLLVEVDNLHIEVDNLLVQVDNRLVGVVFVVGSRLVAAVDNQLVPLGGLYMVVVSRHVGSLMNDSLSAVKIVR